MSRKWSGALSARLRRGGGKVPRRAQARTPLFASGQSSGRNRWGPRRHWWVWTVDGHSLQCCRHRLFVTQCYRRLQCRCAEEPADKLWILVFQPPRWGEGLIATRVSVGQDGHPSDNLMCGRSEEVDRPPPDSCPHNSDSQCVGEPLLEWVACRPCPGELPDENRISNAFDYQHVVGEQRCRSRGVQVQPGHTQRTVSIMQGGAATTRATRRPSLRRRRTTSSSGWHAAMISPAWLLMRIWTSGRASVTCRR